MKYLWLGLFVLFVGIASYLAEELFFPIHPPFIANSTEAMIHADLSELKKTKMLPPEMNSLNEIFFSDHRLKKTEINWESLSRYDFPKSKNGNFDLQIEAFDASAEEAKDKDLSILQFSLFDKKTKNKIWEMSRTYNLPPTKNSKKD